ncbi:MAG: ABC transporter permease [Actinobacteria bacterium]|nr:ABC transporter permease [Actinomycetota bacterium]
MSADVSAAKQPGPGSAADGGVIHNIGYRRYEAERYGRLRIGTALMWHSFRAAFGLGRGAKAKIFPWLLFALLCLPAVVNAVALATNPGSQPIVGYDAYIPSLRTIAMLIFVAIEAPNLVSADLRNHTLPLYFARPIRRIDYPLAKLAAFVLACLVMVEVPLLLLYLGNVTQQHSPSQVLEQTLRLGPGLLYGGAWALLLGSLGLLLASATGKRVFAICAVGIPLFFTFILSHVVSSVGEQAFRSTTFGEPSALASLGGLISPFTLLGGVLHWLQAPRGDRLQVQMIQATTIGHYGPVYGGVFVLLTAAAIGGLLLRYRKVGVA